MHAQRSRHCPHPRCRGSGLHVAGRRRTRARDRQRQPRCRDPLGQHRARERRGARRRARQQDRQLGARRRGHLQLRQRRLRVQAPRPAERVRCRLQEALRWPRQRHGVVRWRLQRPEPFEPERAAGQHPQLRRQPIQQHDQAPVPRRQRRADGCVRVRRHRPRRRAGQPEARPPHHVLGRVAVPRRPPAQRVVRAEPGGPAKGFRHARHRSQGAVPPAEPAVGAGAGHRHAVAGRAHDVRVGSRALSRGRHLPRTGGLRVQRPRPPVPVAGPRLRDARQRGRAGPERRMGPVGALEPRVARRHAGRVLPQLRRQAAADAADAPSAPAPASTT